MTARVGKTKKSNVEFDYVNTKNEYMTTIYRFPILNKWRALKLQNVMKMLSKKVPVDYTKKYELLLSDKDRKNILILHREKSTNIVEVVSAEDSFDLFVDVHQTTGHGGIEKMLHNMRQRYHVSYTCLKIFLSLCNVCQEKNFKKIDVNRNHTAMISLLDLSSMKDGDFGYIMIYKLKQSGFLLLRPITITDLEKELAMELLNIFLDFGPPVKIVVDPERTEIFSSVMMYINDLTCDLNVLLEAGVKGTSKTTLDVLENIKEWIQLNGQQWSMACHLLQWKLNNTATDKEDSPYVAFFKARSAIQSNITDDILKGSNDDDLMNITEEIGPSTSKG